MESKTDGHTGRQGTAEKLISGFLTTTIEKLRRLLVRPYFQSANYEEKEAQIMEAKKYE